MKQLQRDVPLAPYTTLQIGGRAKYFLEAKSIDDVQQAHIWAEEQSLPLFVLGGGSNLLVSDNGFPGLVLKMSLKGTRVDSDRENLLLTVAAGEEWDLVVARTVATGCAGLECLSGIPGSCGATPIQNVGAYGQEVSETILHVSVYDRIEKAQKTLSHAECNFSYRSSIFKQTDRYIVLSVTYRLKRGGTPTIRYPELSSYLAEQGISNPKLIDVREAVLTLRRRKSMVIDQSDPDSRSAGSFFVNPKVTTETFEAIRKCYPEIPSFPAENGQVKIPAAWLIERSGFHKGYKHGRAAISSRHALALVNCGGCSSSEIVALKQKIEQGVEATFGIKLHTEPVLLGFNSFQE